MNCNVCWSEAGLEMFGSRLGGACLRGSLTEVSQVVRVGLLSFSTPSASAICFLPTVRNVSSWTTRF